jgi:hypothetical protein
MICKPLGLQQEAAEDLAFAKKRLKENPHLSGQSHHITELEE